jgi:glycogen debranching enzyme
MIATAWLLLFGLMPAAAQTTVPQLPNKFSFPPNPIELARTARPHTYFDAIGRKAALLGHESGAFESWVFPIKLFHDARLTINVEGQDHTVDFASSVERIIARPEATTLVAANQLFTIRATFFSPIDEAGSIILLDIDTARPLTLTVSFVPDLKPMWPGGFGGQSAGWRDDLKAFVISESRRKFNGFFGSPAATRGIATPAHQLAAGALRFDIKVDPAQARRSVYPLIIAGGANGRQPVIDLYQRLASSVAEQYRKTYEHYRRLREEMMSIETPDRSLNFAFEWAKAALDKGMVDNPDLGYGLIAGWGASGNGARPGFGWFFGGDAAINSYAMTGYGDFDAMRAAFKFLAKYQRADGKITHEISQAAAMIRWFDEYPYAYYHADTTPFYIAAVYNLYRQSGDRQLVAELWEVLKKAYQFCLANDSDGDGILENSKAGLGASELGSLLTDLHQDILLAATNAEASLAMREIAGVMNDQSLRETAAARYTQALAAINTRYWNQTEGRYAYALTKSGQQNMEITAWTAVPMMFGQLDAKRAGETLATLASAQLSTDWGTRMLSHTSKAYNPIAYNNGGVWPFLTGFVAAGEYEYHRAHSALAHLNQLAQLTFDHALGLHPEILSGDYYRPLDESVPHQLFSSGMVITPFIRGLLGMRADAVERRLRFAPQLPAAWDSLRVRNYRIGAHRLSFDVKRSANSNLKFEIAKENDEGLTLQFAPALPPLAKVARVLVDGKPVKFNVEANSADTLCSFEAILHQRLTVEIAFEGGIEVDVLMENARVGDRTSSLKVIEVAAPSGSQLICKLEGLAGRSYVLRARGRLKVQSVEGGSLQGVADGWQLIEVPFPETGDSHSYQAKTVTFKLK